MRDKDRNRRRDGDDNTPVGDLPGLRAEAAEEVEREEAERAADASALAAAQATSARLDFEARQKEQAKADAAADLARENADESARVQYEDLLTAERDAVGKADADARAAGRGGFPAPDPGDPDAPVDQADPGAPAGQGEPPYPGEPGYPAN